MVGWRDPLEYPFIPVEQLGYRSFEEVRKAWTLHRNNPRICQWLDPEDPSFRPGRRPWAWWQFETRAKRNRLLEEHEQLRKMKKLTPGELFALDREKAKGLRPKFSPEAPPGGFLPLPPRPELDPAVQKLVDDATELVKGEAWFPWVADEVTGKLSPADADAVLNHGCFLNLSRGWHAVDYVETFCRQSEGEWEGQPLKLTRWQIRDLFLPLFGWQRPDGKRRFTRGSLWVAKKNGKSTLCSAIQVYGSNGLGEGGPRVFSAAVTKEQAAIVFNEAASMVTASPELNAILEVKESKKEIDLKGGNTSGVKRKDRYVIKALAADGDSNEGKNIFILIKDEMHVWRDSKFLGALQYGSAARREPLNFAISTAGDDPASLGGNEYKKAKKIVLGEAFEFSYFARTFEPPQDLDFNDPRIYLNPQVWVMGNPSLNEIISSEAFYEDLVSSLDNPKSWADFVRYRFNTWVEGGHPFLSHNLIDASAREIFKEDDFIGFEAYGSFDLSRVDDMTNLCWCFPVDGRYFFIWRYWVTEESADYRFRKGDVRYREWADAGFLNIVPGARIDQELIELQIYEDWQKFQGLRIGFDPHLAGGLGERLDKRGVKVHECFQHYSFYDYPMKELQALMKAGAIVIGDNPVSKYCLKNLVAKNNGGRDQVMPLKKDKDRRFKIDGAVTLLMALDGALRKDEAAGSRYDDLEAEIISV